jgi:hypothetical protein
MSSPPPRSQLSALVGLISEASKTIESHFAESFESSVPSLDDITPHPFDAELSSIELKLAIQTLEGACAQLCATAARPNHTIVNVSPSASIEATT